MIEVAPMRTAFWGFTFTLLLFQSAWAQNDSPLDQSRRERVGLAFQAYLSRFQSAPGCKGAESSFWLTRRGARSPLFVYRENQNMLPASTLKVITAASVLEHFGPADRLTTRLLRDSANQLILQGGGDPELSTAQLEQLAREVAPKLPRTLSVLQVDAHLFSQPRYPGGWSWDDFEEAWSPEVRALEVDEGRITWSPTSSSAPWLDASLLSSTPLVEGKRALLNVDLAAGYALRWALQKQGVQIDRVARLEAPLAAEAVVGSVDSRPVYEILRRALAVSDNLVMECLHRLCHEEPPRRLAGESEIRIVDGSGLSRYDLVSTRVLGQTLLNYPTLTDFLAVPAGPGLEKRFVGTLLQGHLHAKTGTMSGVSGLVGDLEVGDEHYVFAMLTNGSVAPSSVVKAAEDDWLKTLYETLR